MKLLPKVLFTGASLPLIILFLNPISITFRLNIHYSEHIFLDIYIKFATIFILGTTEIPDKKNYDIFELRLSVEAAKNLYIGKVNSEVVNRLLESPLFAAVTYMIAQYFDDTLAKGFAAQNQMISSLSAMLLGQNKTNAAVMAVREANTQKVPVYQADLTRIQEAFMTTVKEVKIAAVDGVDQETLDNFNQVLLDLMQAMVLPDDKQDK